MLTLKTWIGSFTVLCTTIPCITFQRFLDIFWIHPVIYKRPAFISSKDLNGEFWSCIKIDPTDKGRYKKADDKHAESNEVVKKTHVRIQNLDYFFSVTLMEQNTEEILSLNPANFFERSCFWSFKCVGQNIRCWRFTCHAIQTVFYSLVFLLLHNGLDTNVCT